MKMISLTDFKKLHEAHFKKMESIDSYVQRKTKQMDTYRSSAKELKVCKSFQSFLNLRTLNVISVNIKFLFVISIPFFSPATSRQN